MGVCGSCVCESSAVLGGDDKKRDHRFHVDSSPHRMGVGMLGVGCLFKVWYSAVQTVLRQLSN